MAEANLISAGRISVNLAPELKHFLGLKAAENGRSLSSEIERRLRQTVDAEGGMQPPKPAPRPVPVKKTRRPKTKA